MQLKPSFQITLYGAEDCKNLPYKLTQFSAGELHPQLQEYDLLGKIESIIIKPRTYNPSFIVELSLLVNALRDEFPESVHFDLDLPYIPYSRQDRVCAVGDAFGLKVFADQLNSLNFRYVIIFDAHSDVSPALINNCINREVKNLFGMGLFMNGGRRIVITEGEEDCLVVAQALYKRYKKRYPVV